MTRDQLNEMHLPREISDRILREMESVEQREPESARHARRRIRNARARKEDETIPEVWQ